MQRFIFCIGLMAAVQASAPAAARADVITQNTSNVIVDLNSTWCPGSGFHVDNSYWRRFDLDGAHNITHCFDVSRVDFGVQSATSPAGSQPVTVRLYTIPNASPLLLGNLTLIGSFPVSVANQTLTIFPAAVQAVVIDPLLADLVVEVFTPDGRDQGNLFIVGSNGSGQSAPCYLSAPGCGLLEPTNVAGAAVAFPNMHIYLAVVGTGCATPAPTGTWGRLKSLYR